MNALETYRTTALDWLNSVAPEFGRAARRGLSEAEDLALGRRYQRAKFDAGYAGINWPKAFGGQALTHIEKITFANTCGQSTSKRNASCNGTTTATSGPTPRVPRKCSRAAR